MKQFLKTTISLLFLILLNCCILNPANAAGTLVDCADSPGFKKRLDTSVKKIYRSRKKIYSLANFKINCDNMNKTQIVEKILVFYEN